LRVRDHVAISTAAAALLFPLVGRRVAGAWAASIVMDADHYAWYCITQRSLNPSEAYRFFNQANPPQHPATRLLHNPLAISIAVALGVWNRKLMPVAVGMAAHAALDVYHEERIKRARIRVLRRDRFTCRWCGVRGIHVVAHLDRQPRFMPSYRLENFITLCPACHEEAHARVARRLVS
jgi:hypothetical protein